MFLKMQIIWILSRFVFFLQGNKNFVTKICIISLLFLALLFSYDAKSISRAFKWPKFAEGFVLKVLSHLEL